MRRIPIDTLSHFNDIYEKYHKSVYKNILKYIHNDQIADDIFQDVFLSLWETMATQKTINSYSSWLYVVSHNKSISFINNAIKENKVVVLKEVNEALLNQIPQIDFNNSHETSEEQLQLLYEAVDKLPKQKHTVFCLNKFEGKDINEIAEILDLTPMSVREYLKQATRTIKMILNQPKTLTHSLFALCITLCIGL